MNREQKLSLIIGFTVILLVGVLISDHLSGARTASVPGVDGEESDVFGTALAAHDVAPFEDVPPVADPVFEPEPIAVIDQSGVERPADVPADAPAEHADLLSEIAQRGGRIVDQGTSFLFNLPETPRALAMTDQTEDLDDDARGEQVWHTVAPDETLWDIAERYYGTGARWRLIAEHNHQRIGDKHQLRVGVRLSIPDRPGMTTSHVPESAPLRTYTVRPNDTIGEISESLLGTSRRWREIVDLNRDVISNENVVRAGAVLKIPAQ